MQSKRGQGEFETLLEQCRLTVGRPIVQACVTREEQKEAKGKAAPAAPVAAATPPPSDAFSVQPTFVAPPRTIADITAILDQEKPDAEKIAARKAEADATPPAYAAPAASPSSTTIAAPPGRCSVATRTRSPTPCKPSTPPSAAASSAG